MTPSLIAKVPFPAEFAAARRGGHGPVRARLHAHFYRFVVEKAEVVCLQALARMVPDFVVEVNVYDLEGGGAPRAVCRAVVRAVGREYLVESLRDSAEVRAATGDEASSFRAVASELAAGRRDGCLVVVVWSCLGADLFVRAEP